MGGAQLRLRVRGGRHARASGSTSARASARRCAFTFERWNGKGFPRHVGGEAIPLADARRAPEPRHGGDRPALLARARRSRPRAIAATAPTTRRSPTCSSSTARAGSTGCARPSRGTPCSRSSPSRTACSRARSSTTRSTVAADFIDLKSPYMGGHSRRCAQLAADAARRARARRRGRRPRSAARRSCTTSARPCVPNSIWDKPGPLTRTEFDRVELHPMLTEQMLRRSPALAALNPVASAHHEKCDGSGYHKRAAGRRRRSRRVRAGGDRDLRRPDHRARGPAGVLAATTRRPSCAGSSRRACSSRARAARCSWPRATASREAPRAQAARRTRAGCPAARSTCCDSPRSGLTTRQIADRLVISPKTADHHIQHIYAKIGVSTRAAAALWAMQHDRRRLRRVWLRGDGRHLHESGAVEPTVSLAGERRGRMGQATSFL